MKNSAWDIVGIGGFALIVGGVAWIHVQSGMIVGGVLMLAAAALASSRRPGK